MERLHRRILLLTGLTAALLCLTAVLAQAELSSSGNLFVTFRGGITPNALPRDERAPITVSMAGKVRTLSGEKPPGLRNITIALNRNGRLDTRGLPTCPKGRVEGATSAQALAACSDALVGTGRYRARTTFPESPTEPTVGKILAFNATLHGRQAILGQVFSVEPARSTSVIVFDDPPSRVAPTAPCSPARFPAALTKYSYLKRISLQLHRTYTYRGRPPQLPLGPVQRPAGPRQGLLPVRQGVAVLRGRPRAVGDPDQDLQGKGVRRAARTAAIWGAGSAASADCSRPPHPPPPAGWPRPASRRPGRTPKWPAGRARRRRRRDSRLAAVRRLEVRDPGGEPPCGRRLGRAGHAFGARPERRRAPAAVDAAGDAIAVWSRFNGAETGTNSIVQAASRPAGGAWGAAVDLSAAGRNAERPAGRARRRRRRDRRSGAATTASTSSPKPRAGRRAAPGARPSPSRRRARAPKRCSWPAMPPATPPPSGAAAAAPTSSSKARAGPPAGAGRRRRESRPAAQDADNPQVALDAAGDADRGLAPTTPLPIHRRKREPARGRGLGRADRTLRPRQKRPGAAAGGRPRRRSDRDLDSPDRSGDHRPGGRQAGRRGLGGRRST